MCKTYLIYYFSIQLRRTSSSAIQSLKSRWNTRRDENFKVIFIRAGTARGLSAALTGKCWRQKWRSREPPTSLSRKVFVHEKKYPRISRTTRTRLTAVQSRPRPAITEPLPARANWKVFRDQVPNSSRNCFEDPPRGWLVHPRIETWVLLNLIFIASRHEIYYDRRRDIDGTGNNVIK